MRFLLAASCFFLSLESWANPRIKQPLIARDDTFLAADSCLAAVLYLQTAAIVSYQAVSEATRVDEGASGESSIKPAVLVVSYWSLGCWEHAGVNVVEFFYHGSQVIAIGLRHPSGDVTWTHAIGRGPLGPCFLKDLTGQGNDYFIFTDHLGTPFAWYNPNTGETTYTPFNPWGELLATPTSGYSPYEHGNVPTAGFNLPTFEVFDVTPLGLAGHIYDEKTGLVYMHYRYLHPRLGHFLTPDFRAPNIYDPSTFTEPYAYAAGNPVMFWDADGLAVYVMSSRTRDPKDDDEFINEWLDYAYDIQLDPNTGNLVNETYALPNPTNTDLANLLQDDVLVFVHGYNVDESSAIATWTEEVYRRLVRAGYTGDVVVLSWLGNEPMRRELEQRGVSGSTKDPFYFGRNVKNANRTGKNLAELVREINQANPNATVNLAAHSLGNRVAMIGIRYAQEMFNQDLDIHNLVHIEAAVDGNVYYDKDRWYQFRGEFSDVALSVDNVFNMSSTDDSVLRWAYSADRRIRRGYLLRVFQPWRRAALGMKNPRNQDRLPWNFTPIATQAMGINAHSAMVNRPYAEVQRFWDRLLQALRQ